MRSFRPQVDGRYLERRRLLDLLPDRPGYVVCLEAPYGYGKSVLASQWAAELERAGWRAVWLSARHLGVRELLATHLGLSAGAPWPALLDTLWTGRTLVVIEELERLDDHEELTPLLQDVRGLLLLASRVELVSSELPRLVTQGRVARLRARDLAFTDGETATLFDDAGTSRRMQALTEGWPLPLHFAALTGEMPSGEALVEGMRASVTSALWEEVLLLATLSHLPADAARDATRELADAGFVQLGDAGFRLHPLVADDLLAAYKEEARAALERAAPRLPDLVLGEALERCGDLRALERLFESPRSQVYRQAPETFLRWHREIPGRSSARRLVTVAGALNAVGRFAEGIACLEEALATGELDTEDELLALKNLCWAQAIADPERAAATVERGEALLDRVDPELAGRFLSDASFVDTMAGRFEAAEEQLRRALRYLPHGSPYRTGARINLALNRWDRLGDLDGRLAAQSETLEAVERLYPSDAPGQSRDVAMLHWWQGDEEAARTYLRRALALSRGNPLVRIEATAALAALDRDTEPFAVLLDAAALWQDAYTLDVVAMHAIGALPPDAPLERARVTFEAAPEPRFAAAAFALRLAAAGEREAALALVDDALVGAEERAYRLYLLAARYRVGRRVEDLEAFLAVTLEGERLLPGFVPLAELPPERPDLAVAYPIAEVLRSGWREAIAARADEAPDLELTLLGAFDLGLLGESVELTDRQRQLVTLFAIGRNRQEAAEALWPEADADRQRNNMGVQMSLLRSALEPWGVPVYVFRDGLRRVVSDHDRLCRALASDDADAVCALYAEPFAPGLDVEEVREHGAWLRRQVVGCLGRAAAAAADHETAVRYLTRVCELEPLDEDATRHLLERLVASGRTAAARRRFEAFTERLRSELGLEPLPETAAALRGA